MAALHIKPFFGDLKYGEKALWWQTSYRPEDSPGQTAQAVDTR